RLRVGGVLPAGEAPLGLLRAPDRLRRPPGRPDRAADRPRPGARRRARRLVGGGLRATWRRRLRRRDARRPPRVSGLRRRRAPRVGAPPRSREAALPRAPLRLQKSRGRSVSALMPARRRGATIAASMDRSTRGEPMADNSVAYVAVYNDVDAAMA